MVACEPLCIPFVGNKMADMKEPFFGLLLVTPLSQITFDYLTITFDIFQPNPYSHLVGYHAHIHINIYIYINSTSSINIRLTNKKISTQITVLQP